MEETIWAEYWWSKITGPREIVNAIIEALRSNKSAFLVIPHDLPWRHELRQAVRSSLESISGLEELIPDAIDIEDEGLGGEEPGRLLLDKYALRSAKANYRAGGKESIQQYMFRKGVMRNRLVWVKGFGSSSSQRWVRFCEDWSIQSASDGLFVVETCEEPEVGHGKRLEVIKYNNAVSKYDVQLFNSLILGNETAGKLNDAWKVYAAAITSHLCGTDAEVAQEFLLCHDFKHDEPITTIAKFAESKDFARRGSGDHVLSLYRNKNSLALKKRLWAGQIEVLFPIIERCRLDLVDELKDQLDREIISGITQFGCPVKKASDIEVGTLEYLCASRRIGIQDRKTRDRVHLLRDCRNSLAHRDTCTVEQVSLLLG